MNCVVCENCEVASDYPACSVCAKIKHFPNVRGGCRHCASMAEAELQSEGVLRRLARLWANESEPDLDAVDRYADASHAECSGMGVLRESDGWGFCSCTEAGLLAAQHQRS